MLEQRAVAALHPDGVARPPTATTMRSERASNSHASPPLWRRSYAAGEVRTRCFRALAAAAGALISAPKSRRWLDLVRRRVRPTAVQFDAERAFSRTSGRPS